MKHYSPADGSIRDGSMYSDNGFWDTYKTVYPMFSLILSDRYAEMVDELPQFLRGERNRFPNGSLPVSAALLPGTMIDPVLADAVVRGLLRDKEKIKKALEGMLGVAATRAPDLPIRGRQRHRLVSEIRLCARHQRNESVNATLDLRLRWISAFRSIAGVLGDAEMQKEYAKRALNHLKPLRPGNHLHAREGRAGQYARRLYPV